MHSALGDQVPLDVIQEQALQWRQGFPDFAVEVQFSIVAGEYVAWLFSMTGTHTGDFYGSPATNLPIIDTGITVLHVRCGKVVESWGAWDRGDFLNQLGLLELPDPDPTDTPATPDAFIEGVCAPASGEETVAIARRYWDVVWGSPLTDVAQLDGVTSLYVEGHLPFQMPIVGQEALVRRVTRWKTCMPDLVFNPHTILGGVTFDANGVGPGAHAVTLWTATGTPTGPYPALDFPGRPDAEPLTWRGIDIFRTNCGRVEEVWSEFDKVRLLEAIRGQ